MDNQQIEQTMLAKGVRPTANRILVLRELAKATRPISMAELEELIGMTLNKASIFRVLELFAEHDIVHEIEDGSRSLKYELCGSASGHSAADEHPHFYCQKCGRTFCLENLSIPKINLPAGYLPHSVNYMVKGLCPDCGKDGSGL
ncbi:MAG: transcriptional repressor [Clostridium sp.]|nr:transcriptional repressor [Clostridium sp.]